MKKAKNLSPFFVLTILLFIQFLTASISTTEATSTLISVDPPYVQVNAESNFTVSIILTDSPAFVAFQVILYYDINALEALNGNITVPWPNSQLSIDETAGSVTATGSTTTDPLQGNQTLATVEFNALMYSNSTLSLVGMYLVSPGQQMIPFTTQNGFAEVIGPISLTVATPRRFYYVGTNMFVFGNATINGSSTNTLIGLELAPPSGTSILRTLASGAGPTEGSWRMNITEFYSCDQYGNPVTSFANGTQAFFTLQVQNIADESLPCLMYVGILNKYNASIGQTYGIGPVPPNSSAMLLSYVNIPSNAYNGSATAYAEVFSDWPRNEGVPYCPEQSVTFYITGGPVTPPRVVPYNGTQTLQSDYQNAFNLSTAYVLGNYSAYATTQYKTQSASAKTTFLNTLMADFNGDGRVSGPDLNTLLRAYISTPAKPNWYPEADFNQDGRISGPDLNFLLTQYTKHV